MRFKKYGTIESINILKKRNKAYVTFKCDRAACLAYVMERRHGAKIAHKLLQPDIEPPILNLNDYCLFAIFDRCDIDALINLSKTCVRFANVLEKQYRFPNINKEFRIMLKDDQKEDELMPLENAKKILQLMGPHYEKLYIHDDATYWSTPNRNFPKYLQLILKNCTNVHSMTLNVGPIEDHLLQLLSPIFKKLRTFRFNYRKLNLGNRSNIDLTDYFLVLKKIQLGGLDFLSFCMKKQWPSLETLYIYPLEYDEIDFLRLNPQIKCIKFNVPVREENNTLVEIARNVPNIEKIRMKPCPFEPLVGLKELRDIKNLTKLTLEELYGELNEIVYYLTKLSKLKQLKLFYSDSESDQQESIITLAKSLEDLERFDLHDLQIGEDIVVQFVRHAKKLKVLHLHSCGIFATESLIANLVNERNNLQSDKLQVFVDRDGRNSSCAINQREAKQLLNFKWNCKHMR